MAILFSQYDLEAIYPRIIEELRERRSKKSAE